MPELGGAFGPWDVVVTVAGAFVGLGAANGLAWLVSRPSVRAVVVLLAPRGRGCSKNGSETVTGEEGGGGC